MLTEFILARLADDERDARDYGDDDSPGTWRRWGEDVCAALRAVVERCAAVDYAMPSTHLAHGILAELATIYADHPDYRPEEWA